MEKDINNEPLLRERSYVKSISAGLRLPLRHPWGMLRQLWPILLLCCLVWFATAGWASADLWAWRNILVGELASPADVLGMPFLRVGAWGALSMLFLGVLAGQTAFLMQRYGELNYFPAVQPWRVWRDVWPHVKRGILLCLVGYLVTLALAALPFLAMPRCLWAVLLGMLLVVAWAFLYVPAGQRYMMEQKSYLHSLASSFRHPSELVGSSAVLVVCGLLLVGIMITGLVPIITTVYVEGISHNAVTMGDPTDLPSSFSFLRNISFFLSAAIVSLSWIFILVPLCFEWGSKEQNKKSE